MGSVSQPTPFLCYNITMTDETVVEGNAIEAISEKKHVAKKPVKKVAPKADDVIATKGAVLFMTSSGGSWATPSGVQFTASRPYQLVPAEEVESLLTSGRFRRAEPQEVKDFYNIEL